MAIDESGSETTKTVTESTGIDWGDYYSQGSVPVVTDTTPNAPTEYNVRDIQTQQDVNVTPQIGLPVVTPQQEEPRDRTVPDMAADFLNNLLGRTPTGYNPLAPQPDINDVIDTRQVWRSTQQTVGNPHPGSLGWDGALTQQQLTEAARLTSLSIFGAVFNQQMAQDIIDSGVNPFPIKISIDLANELPYNTSNPSLQEAFLDAFGVAGFATAADMLTAMNYFEYEPGKWWRADQIPQPIVASGAEYGYGGNGYGSRGGYSTAPRGYSYGAGGLINWRIGL